MLLQSRLLPYVDPDETNVARYVLFILLVQEIISGPFPAAVGFGRHICLSQHLWNGFMTPILNEPWDLEPNCNGCVLSPAPLLLPSTSAPAPAFPSTPLTPALLTSPEPAIEEDDDTTPPESPFLNFSPPTQVFPAFTMSPDQIATIINNSVLPSAAMPPRSLSPLSSVFVTPPSHATPAPASGVFATIPAISAPVPASAPVMITHSSPPVSHFNKEDQASYIAFEQKVNAHLANLQYNQELIIWVPTVAQAANVLLANVLCCANNQEPPAVPTGVRVKNFVLEALFGN
ncbi:hypothetical protein DXG01_000386 [Tephrocybe rancida]|nr:hypothetical protein DXG01_000386 [Tephrocybe rancida]